ncbi:MAG: tetratricopeptide repeat protein [Ktedonobacteraceae bacterium]|nr:tetratricopeptide repeat protein [Ktedonobacteraceae bacterium]
MDVQKPRTRRKVLWGRVLIVLLVLLAIIVSAALWLIWNPAQWNSILPVLILTVLSIIIALFQWLFPITEKPLPPLPLAPDPAITGSLLAPGSGQRIAYRSLLAVPPSTDEYTVQQREKAVGEIYEKLTRHAVTAVVLTGIGGVGKSTLAALVYRYAEKQRQAGQSPFSAPALWLKIDSTATMADLIGTIFESLQKPVPELDSLAPHSQAAVLFNTLNEASGPRLIVLDQFENLLNWQTGQALPDRSGVGEWIDVINNQPLTCRILLTSRPWPVGVRSYLPAHMQEYQVKGLELDEGVQLLRKLGIAGEEEELRRAVERCGGHAFALTLLASLLRNRHLSLSAFFNDPSYSRLWIGNVARNLLDQIYIEQLDSVQRMLLTAFCVYREPVPLAAAQAVADPEQTIALSRLQQALDGLLAQHLLQPAGEGLYQLHTLIVGFANDRFVEDDEQANFRELQAAYARAAHYYRQYAAQHSPSPGQRRQSRDVQPLVEATWALCQAGHWREAYELIVQERLYTDLRRWGNSATLLELYLQLVPLQKWQPAESQAARIYNELGEIYRVLGQVMTARHYFEQALELSRQAGDRHEEGRALNNIGRTYSDTGERRYTLQYCEEALAVCEKTGDVQGKSTALSNIGWAYYDFALMDKALAAFEQALPLYRELEDHGEESRTLNAIGRVYLNLGQVDRALAYHEESLKISREIGDRSAEGWTLNCLGRVYSATGERQKALDYYNQALRIRRGTGNRGGEGSVLNNLGVVYADLGEYQKALAYYEKALSIRRETGNRSGEAKTLYFLGTLHRNQGELGLAIASLKQSLIIRRKLGQRKHEAKALLVLGRCYNDSAKDAVALACYLLALDIFNQLPATDQDAGLRARTTQRSIAALREKLGDAEFDKLKNSVEPQVQQIVDQELRAT